MDTYTKGHTQRDIYMEETYARNGHRHKGTKNTEGYMYHEGDIHT